MPNLDELKIFTQLSQYHALTTALVWDQQRQIWHYETCLWNQDTGRVESRVDHGSDQILAIRAHVQLFEE